eukprot:snap_masked-scaffold_4-processed-gene-7.54-mRNA-1 protein AED:1.00 eAED:1.00 QI:0/-1/0/0/-1/1/1/0/292
MRWAHSCISREKLEAALSNTDIEAIESDILMGSLSTSIEGSNETPELIPIMSHPPQRVSDLSFEEFWNTITTTPSKHIKLDFKEHQAFDLCLDIIISKPDILKSLESNNIKLIFNADVLDGPGRYLLEYPLANINGKDFIQSVTDKLSKFSLSNVSLSLGFRVDLPTTKAYTRKEVDAMIALLDACGLLIDRSVEITFALNARLLCRSVNPVRRLVDKTNANVLIWTAAGEPGISRSRKDKIENEVNKFCPSEKIDFDVQIASSEVEGGVYDAGMYLYGLFREIKFSVQKWV